jgi:hypothetical protein
MSQRATVSPAYAVGIEPAALLVARSHPHGLPQVRMLKLLWLAELRHFERTGERLTPAAWWRYDYGPYSKDVINTVKNSRRTFRVEKVVEPPRWDALMIHAAKTAKDPPASVGAETIAETLWFYEKFTDRELLDEIYADPFYEETAYSHDFNFSELPKYRQTLPASEAERLAHLPTKRVGSIAELLAP